MKCIFFDKTAPEMKALILSEKPADLDLVFWEELPDDASRSTVLAEIEGALTAVYPVTRELMQQMPKLRIAQKVGVGTDNIDEKAANELGIAIGNVPGGNANGVTELTFAYILSLYRHLPALNAGTKNGKWLMFDYRSSSYEIRGKTHGIIGFGNIGKGVARLAKAFGSEVLYYDAFRASQQEEAALGARYVELDELLRQADIISVHVPLLPATANLINAKKLALVKQNAILINVSRGNVVNEADLYQALVEKRLAGAAVDVWEQEPINPANPLLKLDNVIATPHIGGGTVDASRNVFHKSFLNVRACLLGEAFHALNRKDN